ncbi:uncharacterized protein DFL_005450 [Arthrobotrys flagrans]|uniref:Zn(2)-C6 fungal-type domain-containing protein n=1 Tax=Arthrobotrys flagrans TaxID=97331 RepID=A0A436ZXG9_ARTFL|nr:hypothetical protein DFL_005450 [Arthrobotrys flagrans]
MSRPVNQTTSSGSVSPAPKRRQRKSRARGLRTKTGCITCRKRHMKCSEERPNCAQCQKSDRECIFEDHSAPAITIPIPEPVSAGAERHSNPSSFTLVSPIATPVVLPTRAPHPRAPPEPLAGSRPEDDPRYQFTPPPPEAAAEIRKHRQSESIHKPLTPSLANLTVDNLFADVVPSVSVSIPPLDPPNAGLSPANTDTTHASSNLISTELASIRWLGLLAADAAQSEPNFSLSPFITSEDGISGRLALQQQASANRHSYQTGLEGPGGTGYRDLDQLLYAVDVQANPSNERKLWQSQERIKLTEQEIPVFRNFVENVSSWIDLLDPLKHFGTLIPRLALHNVGLMKAILALSHRHLSLNPENMTDRNTAVQYYFETLHYLQTALQFESYSRSQELLASVLIISTYEMLDGSNSGWERHLKGVFWIQRSQNIHGDSGGTKQAVWWAWLRQDVWASFRERRRPLSFWKPLRSHEVLNQDELASRSVYLLAQAVNYCSDEEIEAGKMNVQGRVERGEQLLEMLEDWTRHLGDEFTPLPAIQDPADITLHDIEPLWYHPPQYGIAVQTHAFAKILVLLHRPSIGGYKEFAVCQKLLADCVNVIIGIAATIPYEAAYCLMSEMCLFGAGLCVSHDERKKEIVMELIRRCQRRTNWPAVSLADELQREWEK